jgi:hypothetical protein
VKSKLLVVLGSSFLLAASLIALPVKADSPPGALSDYPVFVAKLPNPNDYSLFANGGWDGNWYVGFNTCWIKKLPLFPPGNYSKAYIGVKLGRMKLVTNPKNIWDKHPVPGAIYMAINSTTAWSHQQSYFVADTEDIPLEGDAESAVEGTGESQWFWAEVPLKNVNLKGDNFLALWSPTPELLTVSSSPVVAAGWGGKDQDTWLTREIQGAPPRDPRQSIGTPITYFQPAMALKLILSGAAHSVSVQLVNWMPGTPDHPKPVVTANVNGDSIESVWLEYFIEKGGEPNPRGVPSMNHTWVKVGRPLWKAPYVLSIEQTQLPPGRVQLRVAAANIWEQRGYSNAFTVEVATSTSKK